MASRAASGPLALSLTQWRSVLRATYAATERANLPLIAGGVAFFGLMAAIPGVAALVAIVGVFGEPAWVGQQIRMLSGVAPDSVVSIIYQEVTRLLDARRESLLAGALFNLALALWGALQGTRWTLMALTSVNRRAEPRALLRRFVIAGVLTLYGLGLGALAILILGVAPVALAFLPMERAAETALLVLRWPILGGAAIAVALVLYRWGPHRKPPPWRWLWPGAVAAPALWVVVSTALTFALREFPAFGAAYGSLASIVALLLWLYATALLFLLGGALNAELEFYAAGRESAPITDDEMIEPAIEADGDPAG
ncbi:MAG: hypothetical protein GC206_01490 [Alphaproteobacteria bacterium]|nr:hypothetical protein [Alphaproteobacteria bacterium]